MCGIVGFIEVNKSNKSKDIIKKMTFKLRHRGPNDYGIETVSEKPSVYFGHTRLSIIDLTHAAHQPMQTNDKNLTLIFNGEIYNYIELRDELSLSGVKFKTKSDTEVVLRAYEKYGVDCFNKFNGMWSIAIFDNRCGTLILSRDRFGKKPLYYYQTKSSIIFASEIKSLFEHPDVSKKPNFKKIYKYLSTNYRYIDIDEESYFQDIFSIPKSSYVVISSDFNMEVHRYWSLDISNINENISDNDAVSKFREILIDSVKIRLRSDVKVGCMLSGGLDSTSITSIAYKILNNPIETFSGITGDTKGIYDETEYIEEVVNDINAKSHYIHIKPEDIFDTINEMLDFHDEPICTVSWYGLYLINKKIKSMDVPVILNGHGGDELLGGYWDHYHYNFYDIKDNKDIYDYEINSWSVNHNRPPEEINKSRKYIDQYLEDGFSGSNKFSDYSSCFSNEFISENKKDINLKAPESQSLLSKRLYLELMHETVPASLRAEDRNTMSQSLESRSPLLDHRLVEFSFSLPNKFKIRDGIGKWILRESMKGILAEKIRTRKDKAGFIAPADDWFRTINKDQIWQLIKSDSLKKRGIYNIDEIVKIFNEHINGYKNHQMFLWQFINLELWFNKFFDEL